MITKRIIPCLDVKDGRVVKGVNFLGVRDVSDPVKLAAYYSESGADELVFYDITASHENRALFTDILTRVAESIFIPLTVGGGINSLADFDRVLKCGADKVSVNSGALRDPGLIGAAAKRYGDQCVVLSVDAKRVGGQFRVFAKGGREDTGLDAIEWVRRGVGDGAGERPRDARRGVQGRVGARDRLGRRGLRAGLCHPVSDASRGGRGACRLDLPLRRGGDPGAQGAARGKRNTGKEINHAEDRGTEI